MRFVSRVEPSLLLKATCCLSLLLCGLACESNPKQPPAQPTPPTKTTAKPDASKTPPVVDADGCVPLKEAKPMHKAFSCIHEAVPQERVVILRSHGDVKRFIGRMTRSCELPEFDFKKYSLVAYAGTASCSVEVKDKICQGNPLTYHVELIADGFCERMARESRFWQVPKMGKDEIINIKRKRSRKGDPKR